MVSERNKYSPHLYLCRFILPLSLSCWFFYSLFLLPACSQRTGSCFDTNKRVPRALTGSGLGPPGPPRRVAAECGGSGGAPCGRGSFPAAGCAKRLRAPAPMRLVPEDVTMCDEQVVLPLRGPAAVSAEVLGACTSCQ